MFGFGGGGGGGFFGGGGPPGRFEHQYQCFPVSFASKDELEKGNKILLPPSALHQLVQLHISYPMLFEVANPSLGRRTHCGVWEFVAEEGMCYMPYWMMCNLLLQEGDIIRVTNTSLPKGSFVKLQPVSSDFLEINNPKAVLETTLRHFATLSVGDCIVLNYNNKKYEIEIIETRPAAAISIIEADVNVDFAPPKDYVEPTPMRELPPPVDFPMTQEEQEPVSPKEDTASFRRFSGAGNRVDGKAIKASPAMGPQDAPQVEEEDEEPWKRRIPKGVKWTTAPYQYGSGHMSSKPSVGGNAKPVSNDGPIDFFGGIGRSLT